VWVLNRNSEGKLFPSSPLEAHKNNTLVTHIVAVDQVSGLTGWTSANGGILICRDMITQCTQRSRSITVNRTRTRQARLSSGQRRFV